MEAVDSQLVREKTQLGEELHQIRKARNQKRRNSIYIGTIGSYKDKCVFMYLYEVL